jgi:hypothetical protein
MPHPGHFNPGKETRCPLYRRLDGPQGQSGWVRKISPPPGFDPRTVQPVASRYTGPLSSRIIQMNFKCNVNEWWIVKYSILCMTQTGRKQSQICAKQITKNMKCKIPQDRDTSNTCHESLLITTLQHT